MAVVEGEVVPDGSSAADTPPPRSAAERPGASDPAATATLGQSHKWWTSKVGPLLGVSYLTLTVIPDSAGAAAVRLGALMWSACLLATVAYVVNDWSDRDEDRRAGKDSIAMRMGPATAGLLMTVPVVAAALPWVALGLPAVGWIAMGAIVALPHIYSDRPMRWKERGSLGLIADAGLAHFFPTAFALAAFGGLGFDEGAAASVMGVGLLVWSAVVGGRGIIDHQLGDLEADRAAGTVTWVMSAGAAPAREIASRLMVVEIAALAVVFAALVTLAPLTATLYGATALAALVARWAGVWDRPLRVTTVGSEFGVLWVSYAFWLPFAALIGLVIRQPALLPLVPLHAVLFRTVAWRWVRNVAGYGRWTIHDLTASALTFLRYRPRDAVVRAFNWFRYSVPDHLRRAWYHGIRPGVRRARTGARDRVDTVRSVKVSPVAITRRQGRRARRLGHRILGRTRRVSR